MEIEFDLADLVKFFTPEITIEGYLIIALLITFSCWRIFK